MLQARIRDRLEPDERTTVSAWLDDRGLAPCFLP